MSAQVTATPPTSFDSDVGNTSVSSSSDTHEYDHEFELASPPASPINKPINFHHNPKLLVSLISYSHAQPLHPAPDLKYDLRSFPGPDKQLRSRYDGTSKRLREWVRTETWYIELFDKVEKEITAKGKELEAEGPVPKVKILAKKADITPAVETAPLADAPVEPAVTSPGRVPAPTSIEQEDDDIEEESLDAPNKPEKVLRVGVMCEMGRHRSVAFVEELYRRQWPDDWVFEVVHRDVGRDRSARKGKNGRIEKGGRPGKHSVRSDGDEDD